MQDIALPDPNLGNFPAPINLQRVDPVARDRDFDRKVGMFFLGVKAVRLVRLLARLLDLALQRRASVNEEFDVLLDLKSLKKKSEMRLPRFVFAGNGHKLDRPIEVGHARAAPLLEVVLQRLELLPRRGAEQHPAFAPTTRGRTPLHATGCFENSHTHGRRVAAHRSGVNALL